MKNLAARAPVSLLIIGTALSTAAFATEAVVQTSTDTAPMADSQSMSTTSQDMTTTDTTQPTTAETVKQKLQHIGDKVNDATITTTIVAKFAVDPLLGPFKIDVSTNNNTVTLSGNLDSNTQYERALDIASGSNGVTGVDAKNLTVTPSNNYSADAFTTYKVKTALLKAQYFNSGDFNAWNLHVETNNGVVYIVGQVHSSEAKSRVMEIVTNVEGVNDVKTDIQVM